MKAPRKRRPRRGTSESQPTDPVTAYALAVSSGEIIAGPHVRDACRRHLDDLERGAERGLRFDVERADWAMSFFPAVLCLNGGEYEGVPFVLLPWQQFIVGSLFGWLGPDGYRRFRVAYIETGKGSGKSPLVAGIGLLMMTVDGEARAEVYAAAVKKDQAKVLFRDAVAMVQQSPDLACRVTIGGGQDPVNLAYLESGSFFRPISSEDRGRGQSGPRPHCALLDEVHEHPTVSMIEFLRAGTKGRRQALIAMITNSGSNRQSPCFEYHQYAAQVCRGERDDDGFFGYVCALDEGDQRRGIPQDDPFKDEACWVKANPSLPALPGMKYLREQVREAKGLPSKEALVRRLNFCQWVDAANPLFEREVWFAVLHHLDFEEYRGRRCWLAIDLSGKADLTAMAIAFESDHGLDVFVEYWTPRDTLAERASRDRWPYVEWEREGYLTGVPGRSIDYAWVAARIAEIADAHEVVGIGFDRYRIDDLERELDEASVEHYRGDQEESGYGIPMYPIGQGFKDMSPAVEAFETAVLNGAMRIDLNPVTTMCAANAVVTKDAAENRKFDKSKATGRIDGMVAIAMVTRLATRPDDDGPSIYETERLTTLG